MQHMDSSVFYQHWGLHLPPTMVTFNMAVPCSDAMKDFIPTKTAQLKCASLHSLLVTTYYNQQEMKTMHFAAFSFHTCQKHMKLSTNTTGPLMHEAMLLHCFLHISPNRQKSGALQTQERISNNHTPCIHVHTPFQSKLSEHKIYNSNRLSLLCGRVRGSLKQMRSPSCHLKDIKCRKK